MSKPDRPARRASLFAAAGRWLALPRTRLVPAALGLLLLAACFSQPLVPYSEQMPPAVLVTLEAAGVRDLRGSYRTALCVQLADTAKQRCDDVLLRFPDEPSPTPAQPPRDLRQRYRIAFVPGLFGECLAQLQRPFDGVIADLQQRGFDVHYLTVGGRGTVTANADQLASALAAIADDSRPLIVFAYSKGLPDTLDMLVRHPAAARRIAAVVGVAGVVNGTPVAEGLEELYTAVGARWPLSACAAGSGGEVHALRREARLAWWRRYGTALGVPLFSLVAVPRPANVSPLLTVMHARLSQIDPRNDGQLIWYDAIVPGGSLLGYVNADHLHIAFDFAREFPSFASFLPEDLPRTALVTAALEVVDAALSAPAATPIGAAGPADQAFQRDSNGRRPAQDLSSQIRW